MRNKSSPLDSVAPIILSGSSPLSNPLYLPSSLALDDSGFCSGFVA